MSLAQDIVWGAHGTALGVAVLAWLWLLRRRGAGKGKRLPEPPRHWLLGHIPLISKLMGPGDHLDKAAMHLQQHYPHLGKLWLLDFVLIKFVQVNDLDAIKEILVTHNYPKAHTYSDLYPFIGERSLLVSQHSVWTRQRKAFNPGFHYQFLKDMVPVFATKTLQFIQRLQGAARSGEVVGVHRQLTMLTFDVICEVVLSLDFGLMTAETPPPVFETFMKLLAITVHFAERPHLRWRRHLPWEKAKWSRLQAQFDGAMVNVIKDRLAEVAAAAQQAQGIAGSTAAAPATGVAQSTATPQPRKRDILSLAISTALETGEGALDLEDVLSQVKTMLFAGHDTTATTVAFCVYEISQRPGVQSKVLEEVDRVLGGRVPTAEDLGQLKYLATVIKESLRLWPPGGSARAAPANCTLQGYDVSGMIMYVGHMQAHRDPDYWGPDAGAFRPERWQDEEYVSSLHPMAYMPFSKGPRDCIGQTFAVMEAKTLLAMLYTHFTFKYAGDRPEEQGYSITSHPKHGVQVTVHARQPQAA